MKTLLFQIAASCLYTHTHVSSIHGQIREDALEILALTKSVSGQYTAVRVRLDGETAVADFLPSHSAPRLGVNITESCHPDSRWADVMLIALGDEGYKWLGLDVPSKVWPYK
jgi:hypothetical protein